MKLTTRILSSGLILLALLSLQACSSRYNHYDNDYSDHVDYQEAGYADEDGGGGYHRPRGRYVPAPANSYHFSGGASPVSHRDRDLNWIRQQNPDGYTIELASDEKPARVAKVLYKTPKLERTAQVRTQKYNKTTYTGIYGTFKNREEAEAALQKLPEDIRQKAGVRAWNQVQSELKPKEIHRPSVATDAPEAVTFPNGAAEQ